MLSLDVPKRVSIQGWSGGVEGHPKCCAIEHRAMNRWMSPARISVPLSGIAQQHRHLLVVVGHDAAGASEPLVQLVGEQSFSLQAAAEQDPGGDAVRGWR